MKHFIIYAVKILIITIAVAIALDVLYTYIFLQSENRGKVEAIFTSKEKRYDVVFLGTSRANNHFVAQMFEDKGLKSFNYGMSGGHLFETSLLLKLMIERKFQIKNIIIEADLSLANDKESEGIAARFLPYIHNSDIIKEHFKTYKNFNELYYIPFYRYMKYETKIGFRETFYTAVHKKTNALDNLGYYPLKKHKNGNMENNIVALKPLVHNKYYEEIKRICKANNINLITVMTPMCSNVKGMNYFDKVKAAYPEIHNYENVVTEDKYFASCGHMNDAGAKIFTARILKDFFKK